jgi:dipeptidase E
MTKLVLYSDQEIPENVQVDRRMLELIGTSHTPKIGYIPSAGDPDRNWFGQKMQYYARLGADLAVYFELDVDYHPEELDQLLACDAIHLSGGNTYHFLYWMRARGMIGVLREYVDRGGVLIGVSAGSILMTPDIGTTRLCGDEALPGEQMDSLDALGLVDFAFVPHINQIPIASNAVKIYSRRHPGTILYGCADGDGIIVNGDRVEFIGEIQKM